LAAVAEGWMHEAICLEKICYVNRGFHATDGRPICQSPGPAQISAKSDAIDNQFIGEQEGVICLHRKRSGRWGIIQTESAGARAASQGHHQMREPVFKKGLRPLRCAEPIQVGSVKRGNPIGISGISKVNVNVAPAIAGDRLQGAVREDEHAVGC
jgi:hypothetical protein